MATQPVNWDEVPDDELTETLWERVEALKGMFPRSLRSKVATTADWSWWAAQKSVSLPVRFHFRSSPQQSRRSGSAPPRPC